MFGVAASWELWLYDQSFKSRGKSYIFFPAAELSCSSPWLGKKWSRPKKESIILVKSSYDHAIPLYWSPWTLFTRQRRVHWIRKVHFIVFFYPLTSLTFAFLLSGILIPPATWNEERSYIQDLVQTTYCSSQRAWSPSPFAFSVRFWKQRFCLYLHNRSSFPSLGARISSKLW